MLETTDTSALVAFVQAALADAANPEKAGPMAAYMKTDMPFYGVQKPGRDPIFREMRQRFAPATRPAYQAAVLALWSLPHREEKYAAMAYAADFRDYVTPESLPLYERLIREGAWWDLVDGVVSTLINRLMSGYRGVVSAVMDAWIDDPDMWIRRAAIISQIKQKQETDAERLFRYCLTRAAEKEFFIRKAIGWALREYSKTSPDAVRQFLLANRDMLSGLSFREGGKHLRRQGLLT